MSAYINYPHVADVTVYSTLSAFPSVAANGAIALAADTDILYAFNTGSVSWVVIGGSGAPLAIGAIDGQSPSANALVIASNVLYAQSASATAPGMVNLTTQSFAGNKTFTGTIAASNLSGTNTGDVTLAAVGSSPSANGASLAGQVLTLQPADTTHPGALTAADWNTFNGKQAAGNYITALTGDVTASGPGSVAATVAKIQGTTVSGTTGSANVVFSSAPTLSNPVVGTQSPGDSSTKAASTAYVDTAGANYLLKASNLSDVATKATAFNNLSPMSTLGDIIYEDATPTGVRLAGNTTTTKKYLSQTGNGSISAVPAWAQIAFADLSGSVAAGQMPALTGDVTTTAGTVGTSLVASSNGTLTTLSALVSVSTITTGTWSATTIALNKGGTGQTTKAAAFDALSPMSAGGDLIYGGASGTGTRLPNGTVNQYLASAGTTSAPVWTSFAAPTVQKFTSTGTQTGWLFTISTSSTVAVGDTYTNNSNTYTVQNALTATSGQVLWMSGTGATSGTTLTRSAGAGTASITFSTKVATATYTTPTSPRTPLYIKIKGIGGGGGGGGSGTASSSSNGTTGVSTGFGANIILAGPGIGANFAARGGAGGTVSLGTAVGISITGGTGTGVQENLIANSTNLSGGPGGNGMFGGAGGGGPSATSTGAESNAATNSGSGGGGGGSGGQAANASSPGGGAGGGFDAIITSPAATYPYVVGTGGAGGSAGTNGFAGGNGADGFIEVIEYYQ